MSLTWQRPSTATGLQQHLSRAKTPQHLPAVTAQRDTRSPCCPVSAALKTQGSESDKHGLGQQKHTETRSFPTTINNQLEIKMETTFYLYSNKKLHSIQVFTLPWSVQDLHDWSHKETNFGIFQIHQTRPEVTATPRHAAAHRYPETPLFSPRDSCARPPAVGLWTWTS